MSPPLHARMEAALIQSMVLTGRYSAAVPAPVHDELVALHLSLFEDLLEVREMEERLRPRTARETRPDGRTRRMWRGLLRALVRAA